MLFRSCCFSPSGMSSFLCDSSGFEVFHLSLLLFFQEKAIENGFKSVNQRFGKMDNQLQKMDNQLQKIDSRVELQLRKIDSRVEIIDMKVSVSLLFSYEVCR